MEAVRAELQDLRLTEVPRAERERDRAAARADRFEAMARKMEREWREEKAVAGSLMERVAHLGGEVERLAAENEELKEQNRDLGFFISGQEKLKQLQLGEDVTEGTVGVPEETKKKGKGKGRKRESK